MSITSNITMPRRQQLKDTEEISEVISTASRNRRMPGHERETKVLTSRTVTAETPPGQPPRAAQETPLDERLGEQGVSWKDALEALNDWNPTPSKGKVR